ncbi:MAG: hypothetical protein BWY76_01825 [bacterium ADurb.Bin429]|nr:MAG: hypothetical protein BWY76_01825 [bacterium ADurb.Bin429]
MPVVFFSRMPYIGCSEEGEEIVTFHAPTPSARIGSIADCWRGSVTRSLMVYWNPWPMSFAEAAACTVSE